MIKRQCFCSRESELWLLADAEPSLPSREFECCVAVVCSLS